MGGPFNTRGKGIIFSMIKPFSHKLKGIVYDAHLSVPVYVLNLAEWREGFVVFLWLLPCWLSIFFFYT